MKALKKIVSLILVLAMALSLGSVMALADGHVICWGAATVKATALNIRSAPSLSADRVGMVSEDTVVVIIEKTNDEWYKINYLGTVGYVASEYLTDAVTKENFDAVGRVNGDDVRMRKGPSTGDDPMTAYDTGKEVTIIGINNGWYKIDTEDGIGYMRSDYIDITGAASARSAAPTAVTVSETPALPSTPTTVSSTNYSLGQQIANFALQFVGYKYVYSEESPERGFDCSGLVWYVYGQFGYKLERRASLQCKNNGTYVSRDELQPGDLVFFTQNGSTASHVGIYIGNGKYVHASNHKDGVKISTLNSYFKAKRII